MKFRGMIYESDFFNFDRLVHDASTFFDILDLLASLLA